MAVAKRKHAGAGGAKTTVKRPAAKTTRARSAPVGTDAADRKVRGARAGTAVEPSAKAKVAKDKAVKDKAGKEKAAKDKAPRAKVVKAGKDARKAPAKDSRKDRGASVKVVRDSFTMPGSDYALLGQMKQAWLAAGIEVRKSELLRAGLHALGKLSATEQKRIIQRLEPVKTGRPAGSK
jgi:hypothetical protein